LAGAVADTAVTSTGDTSEGCSGGGG